MYDKSPALFFNMVCGSVVQIFLVLAPVVWDLCLCCLVLVFHMNWPFLKMVCSAVKTPFPFCFAPSLREQIWLISDVNLWLIPFPFPCCLCGCMSFPFFFLSPTIPLLHHLSATSPLISLSDVSPPFSPSLSISGIQFCRPRGAGFSCGNERSRPEGGSAHRFWDPASGRCLCYRDPVRSPSHPLYWARQLSWEVTHWDT